MVGIDVGVGERKSYLGAIGVDVEPSAAVGVVARAEKLPFADGRLDFVISNHMLEHAGDPVQVLREWRRVLKPGGIMAFTAPAGCPFLGAGLVVGPWRQAGQEPPGPASPTEGRLHSQNMVMSARERGGSEIVARLRFLSYPTSAPTGSVSVTPDVATPGMPNCARTASSLKFSITT